jgi:diguanylate cyclase (GGDEF)-like protein/hemerythrin-like metal-binding protein/PAS domain S-box-containing protein
MELSGSFFEHSLYPMLIYRFVSENDEGDRIFALKKANAATTQWIKGIKNSFERIDDVFESWGIKNQFEEILDKAWTNGRSISSLFAPGDIDFVVIEAFVIGKENIGLTIKSSQDIHEVFPLEVFFFISLDLLCIVDTNGRFVRVNSEFSRSLGYETSDIVGRPILDFVHPDDLPSTISAVESQNKGEALPYFINRYRTKDGDYRYLQWKSMPYQQYIIASARDISEAFSLSLSLEKEFTCDPLTGASNRKFFEHEATRLVNDFYSRGTISSIIMVDIDHFKNVNDKYGHPVGDLVLTNLVQILSGNCRASDTAARVGGEEFAVLLPGTRSTGAFAVAEKMRKAVEAFEFEGVGHITASFGVAELMPDDDLQRWYTRADTALYLAKNNGRNLTVSSDMLYRADERIEISPWQSEFESGNELLDKEHKALFLAGEKLLQAFYRHDKEEEKRRLQKLFRLLTDHFASEEKILHDAGYLDLVAHREIHKALLSNAHFWSTLQKQGRIQSPAFYGFLINKVIGDHLKNNDAKFFPLFRK